MTHIVNAVYDIKAAQLKSRRYKKKKFKSMCDKMRCNNMNKRRRFMLHKLRLITAVAVADTI
ncbi:hypothetical protein, partial [Pseudoalteromonas sp. S1691]|uniref:hypothetical protein n=1 Tax=Pseudoalteromonas sp. S1691 TaxID=579513 RepID=UPI001BB15330